MIVEVAESKNNDFLRRFKACQNSLKAIGKKLIMKELGTYTRDFEVVHKYGNMRIPVPEGMAPETIPVKLYKYDIAGDIDGDCNGRLENGEDSPELRGKWTVVGLTRQQSNSITYSPLRKTINGIEVPDSIRHAKKIECEHCKANRLRHTGLIVQSNVNPKKFLSIGTACIDKFMGVPVQSIMELFNLANEDTLIKNDEIPGAPQYKIPLNYSLNRDLVIALLINELDPAAQTFARSLKGGGFNSSTYGFLRPRKMAFEDKDYDDQWNYPRPTSPEEYDAEYMKGYNRKIDTEKARCRALYGKEMGKYKNCDVVINYAAYITYGEAFLKRLGQNAQSSLAYFARRIGSNMKFKDLIEPCKDFIKELVENDAESHDHKDNWKMILRSATIDQDAVKKLRAAVALYLCNKYSSGDIVVKSIVGTGYEDLPIDEARENYRKDYDQYMSDLSTFRTEEGERRRKAEEEKQAAKAAAAVALKPLDDMRAQLETSTYSVESLKSMIGQVVEFPINKITGLGNRPREAKVASYLGEKAQSFKLIWWANQDKSGGQLLDPSTKVDDVDAGLPIYTIQCKVNDVKAHGYNKYATLDEVWVTPLKYDASLNAPSFVDFLSNNVTPIPASFSASPELPLHTPITIDIASYVDHGTMGRCKTVKFTDAQGHTFQLPWNSYYHKDADALGNETAKRIENATIKEYYPATGLYVLDMIGNYKVS